MYLHSQELINEIAVDQPDPAAANALQEGLGGQLVRPLGWAAAAVAHPPPAFPKTLP